VLAPPPLFRNKKEFLIISAILVSIIIARLIFVYQDYQSLKSLPNYYYTEAQVIKIYETKSNSTLLKLHSNTKNLDFFLYTNKEIPKRFDWVRVKLKLKKGTSFFDYLKGFFAYGDIIEHVEDGFYAKAFLRELIDKQHNGYESIKTFYYAIFLADPLDKNLRDKISSLGVSHLVALSGFHLGILWLMVFAAAYVPYRYFQQKYYPYRNRNIDLGLFTLIFLALFTLFVGAPASLIRSYVMLFIGWVILTLALELLSFKFLAFAVLLILAVAPKLVASLSLLLSMSGVFYIFLVIKYFQEKPAWFISLVAIPVGIFLLMFPIGHYFFPNTTIWQLCSPILSVLFILFYPLVAILHLFGLGSLFDGALLWLFNLPKGSIEIYLPNYIMAIYVALSISAVFSKRVFYATLIAATLITAWYMGVYLLR
jgi:competence protein ComEC